MYTLQHPSIVRMFSSFVEETGPFKTGLFVVMEILDSTLEMNIANRKGKPFPEPVVQHWAKQLISVFKFIHLKGLIHCDVKSKVSSTLTKKTSKKFQIFNFFQNIFITTDKQIIKLGPFEIVTKSCQPTRKCISDDLILEYNAPEIWRSEPYTQLSDMWSVGCLFYEIATLTHPVNYPLLNKILLNKSFFFKL